MELGRVVVEFEVWVLWLGLLVSPHWFVSVGPPI